MNELNKNQRENIDLSFIIAEESIRQLSHSELEFFSQYIELTKQKLDNYAAEKEFNTMMALKKYTDAKSANGGVVGNL